MRNRSRIEAARRESPTAATDWPIFVAGVLIVLNAMDGVLTLAWVHADIAEEANALWGDLVRTSPVLFIAVKVVAVSLATIFLCRERRRRLARVGLLISFSAYAAVLMWHLVIASVAWTPTAW